MGPFSGHVNYRLLSRSYFYYRLHYCQRENTTAVLQFSRLESVVPLYLPLGNQPIYLLPICCSARVTRVAWLNASMLPKDPLARLRRVLAKDSLVAVSISCTGASLECPECPCAYAAWTPSLVLPHFHPLSCLLPLPAE